MLFLSLISRTKKSKRALSTHKYTNLEEGDVTDSPYIHESPYRFSVCIQRKYAGKLKTRQVQGLRYTTFTALDIQ
jgi:hypothetical protein